MAAAHLVPIARFSLLIPAGQCKRCTQAVRGHAGMPSPLTAAGAMQIERYQHKYPYDWRTKQPTMLRATEQWFASVRFRMTARKLRGAAAFCGCVYLCDPGNRSAGHSQARCPLPDGPSVARGINGRSIAYAMSPVQKNVGGSHLCSMQYASSAAI